MARASKKEMGISHLPQPETINLRPQMHVGEDIPQYYINHVEVNSIVHDFVLSMGRLPGRLSPEVLEAAKKSGVVSFPAELQVLVPPTLIVGLIKALTFQKELYEKQNDVTLIDTAKGTPYE